MRHLTHVELQEFVDHMLDESAEVEAVRHVESCSDCAARVESLKRLGRTIRLIPHERASHRFVQSVMKRMRVGMASPLSKTILQNLSPILALTVFVIVYAILGYVGVLGGAEEARGMPVLDSFLTSVRSTISGWLGWVAGWIQAIVPLANSGQSLGTALYLLVLFSLLALLDKYLVISTKKRRR